MASLVFRSGLAAAMCLGLSACGGEDGFVLVSFDQAIAAVEQAERLDALGLTTANNMPDTGSASYTGYGVISLDPQLFTDVDNIGIVGDATLVADFSDAGAVTGRVFNLEAVTGAGTSVQIQATASGSISIGENDTLIGVVGAENAWASDYEGNITVNGQGYELGGFVVGQFVGNRTSNPTPDQITKGIVGSNIDLPTEFAETSGGSFVPVTIVVFGETDP